MEEKQNCISENIFDMNINDILDSCRICMARCSDMCYIFDDGKTKIIRDIEFCTGLLIKNEASLPTKVCETCLGNLSIAFSFKTSCLLADNTFRRILDATIKTELLDAYDNSMNNESPMLSYDDVPINNCTEDSKIKEEIFNGEIEKENHRDNSRVINGPKCVDSAPAIKICGVRKTRGPYKKRKLRNVTTDVPKNTHKIDPLACVICNLKFENKLQAVRHRKDQHMNTKCWLCEICGKVFVHRGSHYSHVKSHHPPDYACNHCDYKTWQKHDLVKHLRRHDGIKLYQCEYCTASYYIVSNLINHIRRIHQGEKRYSCDICQKRFYDRTKLNRHIDSHNDIKRFECDVCHACFTRRCYWKKHLLRQHGVVTPPQRPGRQKINFLVE